MQFPWGTAALTYLSTLVVGPRTAARTALFMVLWFVLMFFTYGPWVREQNEAYDAAVEQCWTQPDVNACFNAIPAPSTPLWMQLLVFFGWLIPVVLFPVKRQS
jgi:hypothetical protein